MKMMEDVYNAVGAVPKEGVCFENVIKPLIDFEGEVHYQKGVLSVSSKSGPKELEIIHFLATNPLPPKAKMGIYRNNYL